MHRYQCTDAGCGWHGLLGQDHDAEPARRPTWVTSAAWFFIGAVSALGAVQGARLYLRPQIDPRAATTEQHGAAIASRSTPPGQDYGGQPLPEKEARVKQNTTPLNLLQSCAWGVPGGNPYRGTVSQALLAAQLPPEIVREISEMAARGWVSGQVEISRNGIFTVDHRRNFGKTVKAMGFGNTLCFDTRVNFKPGHVEYATLYEATDERGKTYSVMVPYVCQNVAVLGERYEAAEHNDVPEPASWTLSLLALGALAWTHSHRNRAPVK